MFTDRKVGLGIFYENNNQNTPIKNTIENGDQVVLHIGEESVLVKAVQVLGDSSYSGKVYGFEPSFSPEFEGINIEDEVNFKEKHIISCSS